MDRINKRKSRESKFEASLHGMKIDVDESTEFIKPRELTEEEELAIENARKSAISRIGKKYGRSDNQN